LRGITGILNHLQKLALFEFYRTALATLFFLKVLGHDVDMVREGLGGEEGDKRRHWRILPCSLDKMLIVRRFSRCVEGFV
jgi:hypothetical protein